MKFATKVICINPLEPVKQAGHMTQTELISTVHDDLHARILYLEQDVIWIHVSIDNLGFPRDFQDELQSKLSAHFTKPMHITVSCTHSHHCVNPRDVDYRNMVLDEVKEAIHSLSIEEIEDIQVSYQSCYFDQVGKSRISNHTAEHIYVDLIELSAQGRVLADLIIHNVHPTILFATTPYFSAEYPGYVLNQLNKKEPEVFHTFMQGADGDISTRFTRKGQDYEAVEDLGNHLLNQLLSMKQNAKPQFPCHLTFDSTIIDLEHEFEPIDMGEIPDNITDREKETIGYGQIMRQRLKDHPETLVQNIMLSRVGLGSISIIYMPNEMFSWYLGQVDKSKTSIACYSNGYAPYVTGIGSKLLTYETFTDTMTQQTKEKIVDQIQAWGK